MKNIQSFENGLYKDSELATHLRNETHVTLESARLRCNV